jgi:two-component system chemotaxis response regulator CheB
MKKYRAVVAGCSAGGMQAVATLLAQLGTSFRLPLIIVQHLHREQGEYLFRFYSSSTHLKVQEAAEREKILPGNVYVAPPDYHLLIEYDETFSLSVEEKVNFCRPSIDVLFESAADVYGPALAGVVLTGANSDGALGLKRIKDCGGLTLVQRPETAQFPEMPRSALLCVHADQVLTTEEIGRFLMTL